PRPRDKCSGLPALPGPTQCRAPHNTADRGASCHNVGYGKAGKLSGKLRRSRAIDATAALATVELGRQDAFRLTGIKVAEPHSGHALKHGTARDTPDAGIGRTKPRRERGPNPNTDRAVRTPAGRWSVGRSPHCG